MASLLTTPPPPVPWVVEPLLARGHLTMLTGREGKGKSLLSLAVAAGLLTGDPVAGMRVPAPGRVVVIDAENHEGELHRRLHALGLSPHAVANRLEVFDASGLDLTRAEHVEALVAEVEALRPDVLVIDSMRSTWSGKENDSEAAGPHLDRLRSRVARALDAAVLLLHHDSKNGGYRGSTAIGASVDLMWHLESVDDDPEPDRRRLRPGKFRIGAEPPPLWLRLYGEPTLGIVEVESAPPFTAGDDGKAEAPVRAKLDERVRGLLADGVERRRADVARALGRDAKDRTTGRVLEALREQGAVVRDDDGFYRAWREVTP